MLNRTNLKKDNSEMENSETGTFKKKHLTKDNSKQNKKEKDHFEEEEPGKGQFAK